MENRDRDKLSRNVNSTSGGDVARSTSQQSGKKQQSDADFGKKIEHSEDLNEPGRGSSSDIGSSDRSSPSGSRSQGGSMGSSGSDRRPSGGQEQ